MNQKDFFQWPDNSSAYKISRCKPRPYLSDMVEIVATRGEYNLMYRTDFSKDLVAFNFITEKFKKASTKPPNIPRLRGIKNERKQRILKDIVPLIPPNRQDFWKNLSVNDYAIDLRTNYEVQQQ